MTALTDEEWQTLSLNSPCPVFDQRCLLLLQQLSHSCPTSLGRLCLRTIHTSSYFTVTTHETQPPLPCCFTQATDTLIQLTCYTPLPELTPSHFVITKHHIFLVQAVFDLAHLQSKAYQTAVATKSRAQIDALLAILALWFHTQ